MTSEGPVSQEARTQPGEFRGTAGAEDVMGWLLSGDVAVQYQATRDLRHRDDRSLQERIPCEGHGAALLAARTPTGHWGRGYYQPKWTCTHYTLLELAALGCPPTTREAREAVRLVLRDERGPDGGITCTRTVRTSEACVSGMALRFSAYFGADVADLESLVDYLLSSRLPDGGFNCRSSREPTSHSSVHSTVCVLEGLTEYLRCGHAYRAAEVAEARRTCVDFFLRHRLFRSERTGAPMSPEFLRLHHPPRWHFDVLRGLDALADAGVPYQPGLDDALEVVLRRRRPDGRWAAARAYPGVTHVPSLPAGAPHPWVTLAALRVLAAYGDGQAGPHRPPARPVRNSTTSPSART